MHAAWYLGLIALLGTGTALPWIAGQLMADVFTPVLVVCLWLVGEGALASRAQRLALYALISLCVMVHLTHLPLGLGLLGVGYVLARGRGAPNPARAQLAALLALLAGLGGIAGFNASRTGKWTLASGSDAFLLAHLVESGIAGAQLEARCPERGYMLCAVRTQLPMSTDEFLWADKLGLDPWNNLVAVRAETRHLLHDSLRERPLMHLSVALHYTLRALGRFGTGEGLDNDAQPLVSAQIARFTPGDVAAYHAARQQQNAIPVASLRALHTPLGWLLQAVGLVLLLRALKRGREAWQLPALRYVAFAAAAILLNALLCANLSGVYDRYQSRLVWLLAVGLWAPLAQGITRLGSASARRAIDAR